MNKTSRVRLPDQGLKLKSWDDVSLCLKEICECELYVEQQEAELTQRISDLKLEAEDKAKPHQERIAQLENDIKDFVDENRSEMKGKPWN